MSKKTLILALGNPILGDDRVGLDMADLLAPALGSGAVVLKKECVGGLDLLPQIEGYSRLIVLDAIKTGTSPPGTLCVLDLSDLTSSLRLSSPHDVNFATALEVGRGMGMDMPEEVRIYAIEAADLKTFREGLSPCVSAAVEPAVRKIISDYSSVS